MRVLLLGGTGFIGAALAERLRAEDHRVVTVSSTGAADVRLDLTAPDTLEEYLVSTEFDTVVNLAGAGLTSGTADPTTMTRINTDLPPRLLRALAQQSRDADIHLIHASSSTERPPGHDTDESEYSRTKHEGTSGLESEYARLLDEHTSPGVRVSVCRVHNTYGPGQPSGRFIAHVISRLSDGLPVTLRHPDRVRDFIYLDDTVTGLSQLVNAGMTAPSHAELGTGVGVRLRESAECIANALDRPVSLVLDDEATTADPNPVTIASERFGSLGVCRVDLADGIELTVKGA